jgi:probable phosphoglycerate mutase
MVGGTVPGAGTGPHPALRSAAVPAPTVYRQHRFTPPPGSTTLLLVRHGESMPAVTGESFPLVAGHGDPPLSEEGRQQAEAVGRRLADQGIDAIVVTTLCRTAQTAAPLAQRLGLVPVVAADLREVYLGDWEGGLFRQKVGDGDPLAVRMAAEQRWDVIPNAETPAALAERVRRGVETVSAAHVGQRVAVFSHGGAIGEMLRQASGCEPFAFIGADNASISEVVVTPQRWVVRRFNDTAHLRSP